MSKAQLFRSATGCCDSCGAEGVTIYDSNAGWVCVSCVLEDEEHGDYTDFYLDQVRGVLAAEHKRANEQQQSAIYLTSKLAEVDTERLALKHKAEQYDDVVAAVQAADGGRYRNDTIEALLHRLSTLASLRSALEPFARLLGGFEGRDVIYSDDSVVAQVGSVTVLLGDLRRAAEAVGGQNNVERDAEETARHIAYGHDKVGGYAADWFYHRIVEVIRAERAYLVSVRQEAYEDAAAYLEERASAMNNNHMRDLLLREAINVRNLGAR